MNRKTIHIKRKGVRTATAFTMALSAFIFSSCIGEDETFTPEQEITLTTPVLQLGEVQASTRVALGNGTVLDARVELFLHDSEAREKEEDRCGYYDFGNDVWQSSSPVTVIGGEGNYRAGIFATVSLKAAEGMPAIHNAVYAYRGSIRVTEDGIFSANGKLEPYTAAVLVNLKDANGTSIVFDKYDTPDGEFVEGAKKNTDVFRINPVGLSSMFGFKTDTNGQYFPNGTADPVRFADNALVTEFTSDAYGIYIPGTYPATWEGGDFMTSAVPTAAWPLFEVTYCKEGFDLSGSPIGTAITWTIRYPAKQLKLDAGKLYTFTITLDRDSHITLDAEDAVSIASWTDGSIINVGR